MEQVARILAQGLRDFEIERVFGIPGGENVEIVDALRQEGIRFVLVHHESSAVFMADAAARLTGRPAACLTTLGPGATNSAAGVAHAFLDRSPVIVITAQIADDLIPNQTHQFIDLAAFFAPITKASIKLKAEGATRTVRRALELTRTGRPGPVHLQVSNAEAGRPALDANEMSTPLAGTRGSGIDLEPQFAAARQVIARSRRPIIVVGLGLEPERPYEALRMLAEAARAPVITTPKGKGSLPDDHDLAAGTIGLRQGDPANSILDEADCILAVGFDAVELVKPWNQSAPLIWIAPWKNEEPFLPSVAEFVGPTRPILLELCKADWSTSPDWGERRVHTQRQELAREQLPTPAQGRLLPQDVLSALRNAAPRDAIVTVDVGSHKILASLSWPTYTPNSFLVSNGLSCMGFGLPAAIAASLVDPSRRVICITGDAGLMMALGELGVLRRLGTSVLVVVLNDGALDLIRSQQVRAGKEPFGTEFNNPDFVRIGEAYGMRASRVYDRPQLQKEIQTAIEADEPTLLEVMIDPAGYPTTPLPGS